MTEFNCRVCGMVTSLDDFPKGQFECPQCGWRELIARPVKRSPLRNTATRANGAAEAETETETETAASAAICDASEVGDPEIATTTDTDLAATIEGGPDAFNALDLAELRLLSTKEFTRWCAALLERFGYTVRAAGDDGGVVFRLELRRRGHVTIVDCIGFDERENLGRPEGKRLYDAIVSGGADRGILISPGSFEGQCRVFVEDVSEVPIELIDGEHLEQTIRAMTDGPLRGWWDDTRRQDQ